MKTYRSALLISLLALAGSLAPLASAQLIADARGTANAQPSSTPANVGYYRQPAIRGSTLVFVSEGDLWKVSLDAGKVAGPSVRLTTHINAESDPAISPDGQTVAFIGTYEGGKEVYTMPLAGGLPTRRTYDGIRRVSFTGWTPDGKLLYATEADSTLPQTRTFVHDLATDNRTLLPLAQCADATIVPSAEGPTSSTIIFTRLAFQGSQTDRYVGGTAQNLWSFGLTDPGENATEARPLTGDYAGTSKRPTFNAGRVYFQSDRSGTMNVWSMKPDGSDLKQLTSETAFKAVSYAIDGGTLVYQRGADLMVLGVDTATGAASGEAKTLAITLPSDMDQTRERWVEDPKEYITSAALNTDGSRVVITARGRVFNVPVKHHGRLVDVDPRDAIRYREARFLPDGKSLIALSDESGEVEIATIASNGTAKPEQITRDAETLRWKVIPSPDGTKALHTDKRQRLWMLDVTTKQNTLVHQSMIDQISDYSWSPDGRYVAYVTQAPTNAFSVIKVWDSTTGTTIDATSDRYDSYSPTWVSIGEGAEQSQFLAFLSDRTFKSVTPSPWGPRQPEPFLDEPTKVYLLALKPGTRSPFEPENELVAAAKAAKAEAEAKEKKDAKPAEGAAADAKNSGKDAAKDGDKAKKDGPKFEIDAAGLAARLIEVPAERGNFSSLVAGEGAIFWLGYSASDTSEDGPPKATLFGLEITSEKPEVKKIAEEIVAFSLSGDKKKMLLDKGDGDLFVIDAKPAEADLKDAAVDLSKWRLSVTPRQEWRQMTIEAWRLLRDYFYDPKMHGADWKGVLEQYLPLAERVRSRDELNDILAQMTGELSALHHFVVGGDVRVGKERAGIATLGATLVRADGGWRVDRIFEGDIDEPHLRSPLAEPGVDVVVGEIITHVNGQPTASMPHIHKSLRTKGGQEVLLTVKNAAGASRDVIVKPLSSADDAELRYRAWEVSKRKMVEELGKSQIGYVHLRAMGAEDFTSWARDFYPVFTRKGLVIDVRDNNGGNIDSWILSRLLRKAWMFWSQPVGRSPTWNMQYAFRGHIVVLCNESTASDGEAFTEGVKRLGIGKVIGTRTWGGGIWLSFSNYLVDKGIASAGEFASFGADGAWMVEAVGATPDVTLDNPPHATFKGEDAQLKAAIEYLQKQIAEKPVEMPPLPTPPNRARPTK